MGNSACKAEGIEETEARGIPTPIGDAWVNSRQAAEICGITPADFRTRVHRGLAPQPDDPDEDAPRYRRNPRWRLSTIQEYAETRSHKPGPRPRIPPTE